MKVLNFEEFVSVNESFMANNGKRLAPLSKVAKRINTLGHRIGDGDLDEPAKETEERFKEWNELDFSEQEKKHKQRAEKKMTTDKIVATLWTAIKMYGNDKKYENIIKGYADRVMNVMDMKDYELNGVLFE